MLRIGLRSSKLWVTFIAAYEILIIVKAHSKRYKQFDMHQLMLHREIRFNCNFTRMDEKNNNLSTCDDTTVANRGGNHIFQFFGSVSSL